MSHPKQLPCEKCGEPVRLDEFCGNDKPDGDSEFLCPECYVPQEDFKVPCTTVADIEASLRTLSVDMWKRTVDDPETATVESEEAGMTPHRREIRGFTKRVGDLADAAERISQEEFELPCPPNTSDNVLINRVPPNRKNPMITLVNPPSSPLSAPDGLSWKQKYLKQAVWNALNTGEHRPGLPVEWTNHEETLVFQQGAFIDDGIIEYTAMHVDVVLRDSDTEWIDSPFQVIFNIGGGEHEGVEVTIEVHDPHSRRSIERSKRFEQWMEAAGVKFSTSHKVDWTGFWEDDCALFVKVLNETFDKLSEYGNSPFSQSKEEAYKRAVDVARAREQDFAGVFVNSVFAGGNDVYTKFDEGEICLDVAYGQMTGVIESDGHMLLRPEMVSDLALILEDLVDFLEPMVKNAETEHAAEVHMASLATAECFRNWCALAKERLNETRPREKVRVQEWTLKPSGTKGGE